MRVSEIRVKRIRVNQGLGVVYFRIEKFQVRKKNSSSELDWFRKNDLVRSD